MEDPRQTRGSATLLMALVLALAGMLAVGAARLGGAAADRARAHTAADAAALAGAVGDRAAAASLAAANGGRLTRFEVIDDDVLVTVRVGRAWASARARPRGGVAGSPQTGVWALPVPRWSVPANAWARPHHDYPAVDLPVAFGTPVAAITGGRVQWIADGQCGIGVSIEISPAVRSVYCHGAARSVAEGVVVSAGQEVMRSGSSGRSTGPHLHLGLFVGGRSVCPQPLLSAIVAGRIPPSWDALPSTGCVA